MASLVESSEFLKNARDVFLLFMLPIGGGIPAGVVVGNSRGMSWEFMTVLYFFSDLVLACLFDPAMKIFIHYGRRSPFIAQLKASFKQAVHMTTSQYGPKPPWYLLILISFGVDPMSGRAIAYMAGHGFITGWAIAIAGDMIFFLVVMASTLWLNSILGDGMWAAVIITLTVMLVPTLVKRVRASLNKTA